MSVTIEAGVLASAMKSASALIESANTIPILANVRLRADGDRLEVLTSNMEVEYRQIVRLSGGGELFTTVDARKLAALASAADRGAQISLNLDAGRLVAKSGRSRWVLPIIQPKDFPELSFAAEGDAVEIPGKMLAGIIARTAWSASTETTRHYLNGIFLDPEGDRIRFTSTNGHTFVSITSDLAWPRSAPVAIIATRFARIVERVATDAENVLLAWDDGKIRVEAGSVVLTGKLIAGTFPDYRRIIPGTDGQPILIDPDHLRRALRRIELVASERTRAIALDIQAGTLALQIADAGGGGEASEQVPADCQAQFRTGFNAAYLGNALDAIGGDTVEIFQSDPSAVALIRRAVADGAICGVMPMRV